MILIKDKLINVLEIVDAKPEKTLTLYYLDIRLKDSRTISVEIKDMAEGIKLMEQIRAIFLALHK